MGDRANKFIGLLSERYTGLSPGSRAPRGSRGTKREMECERRRLSRGRARKIVKTLYNSAEGRYSGHLDDESCDAETGEEEGDGRERERERNAAPAGEIQ